MKKYALSLVVVAFGVGVAMPTQAFPSRRPVRPRNKLVHLRYPAAASCGLDADVVYVSVLIVYSCVSVRIAHAMHTSYVLKRL